MKQYGLYKNSGVEWIGSIPDHWKIIPFKHLFSFGRGLPITKADLVESGLPVISYGQIHSKTNPGTHLKEDLFRYVPESFANGNDASLVKPGDVLFADTSEDLDGCGNCIYVDKNMTLYSGYHTIIAKTKVDNPSNYVAYLFKTNCWRSQLHSSVNGVKVYSITQNSLGNTTILLPTPEEQCIISSYLDSKVKKIDSIITEKQTLVDDLQNYRKSIISEIVTKGLNPNIAKKDSGVDWIGSVPSHWLIGKAKYYVTITHGSDPKTEGNTPVYGSGSTFFKFCGEYKEGPTVLIGRKGATLHIPHYIEGRYWNVDTAFDVKSQGNFILKYYYYLAMCFDYNYYISQTTLPGMAQSDYNNMLLPIPPLTEQTKIVEHIDSKIAIIDNTLIELQSQINDLQSYKSAVITEAVTGKIDLRNSL